MTNSLNNNICRVVQENVVVDWLIRGAFEWITYTTEIRSGIYRQIFLRFGNHLIEGIGNVVLIQSEGKDRVRTSAVQHDTDTVQPTL